MKLIDGDALSNWMKDYGQKCIKGERKISLMYVWKHIQDMPTIEERKTGKWIISNANNKVTTYKCSECGRIVHDDTGYDVSKDYPYCHCGSDMRGELLFRNMG